MSIRLQVVTSRVVELLVNPAATWQRIAQEDDDPRQLVWRYVLLLAAAAAACLFVGNLLFGQGFWFSLIYALLLLFVFTSLVFAQGLLINALAPLFETAPDEDAALRLAAYCATPVCVAGLTTLAPSLTPLAVLAGFGYSAYLFHAGCAVLLETPPARKLKFALVATGAWFVMVLVVALVVSRVAALLFAPALVMQQLTGPAVGSPTPPLPGSH